MNRKFVSKSNRVLRKILNSKENLDILKDFIESFLDIEIYQIELNPYLGEKSKNFPTEENFGVDGVISIFFNFCPNAIPAAALA